MPILTSNKARSFAETLWGRGGTNAYRTNRPGAFYYSCSGHGGYVVDGGVLTKEERAEIDKYVSPETVLVVTRNGKPYFIQNPSTVRTQRYRVYTDSVKLRDYPIYFFEEDCDWAVLEKFTNIRAGGRDTDPAIINRIFNQWVKRIA